MAKESNHRKEQGEPIISLTENVFAKKSRFSSEMNPAPLFENAKDPSQYQKIQEEITIFLPQLLK